MTSDLQTLIHTNARLAYDQGVKSERQRIIGLLEKLAVQQQAVIDYSPNRSDNKNRKMVVATSYQIAALIKGEQE